MTDFFIEWFITLGKIAFEQVCFRVIKKDSKKITEAPPCSTEICSADRIEICTPTHQAMPISPGIGTSVFRTKIVLALLAVISR